VDATHSETETCTASLLKGLGVAQGVQIEKDAM
jgi:hypothetical protein